MHRHDTRLRPAFALGGTIMFLFVLLILIMVVRSFLIWSHLSTNPVPGGPIYGHQQAYNTGVKIGIWAAPIFGPLIVLAIAWFIGWLVSLMFGKSDDAGNIGAGIIMVAALALFGYSTYATAVAPSSPPPATTAGPPPPTAPASSPLATQPPPPTIAPAPIVQAPPPVISEPGPPPQPITIAPPRPSSASPSAAQPPIDTTSAIEAVETPITQQLDDLIAVIDTFFPELAKRPPHEIRTINSRLESIKTLRAGAEAIKQPLEAAQTELKLRLIKLGMSEGDAQFESFKRIYQVFNSPRRKFGLDAVIRLCDKATEEHIFLRDNIAKWTIDSKGELVSKDIAFKQKAGSNHFFVKADAERPEFITKQLRGQ